MNQFSISQLAQFSGIKPHTIRIWEQRYNALQPQRSEGNTRYYDGAQLRRLLNIVSLSKSRLKISRLCAMNDDELFNLLQEYYLTAEEQNDYDYFVNRLVAAGMSYDEDGFTKLFSHCLLRFGLVATYKNIIYPMLNRVGLMWSANSIPPSQEHYITNLIRQKLFTSIDAMASEGEEAAKWLLFLPENEFHEIGLLFAGYLLKSTGNRVIYLGANVPLTSVKDSLEDTGADHLMLFLVHKDLPENISEFLDELSEVGKNKEIFIACSKELAGDFSSRTSFNWIHSVEDLEKELDGKGANINSNT